MNGKRWFWVGSLVVGILVFVGLLGGVTQTALMQNDEVVSRQTAVTQQGAVRAASQGGDTAVNITAVNALIPDGSFENNPSLWTEADNTNSQCSPWIGDWESTTDVAAYDGRQYFWGGGSCTIDGATFVNSNSASITVSIPTETPAISFWYWADRIDSDSFEDYAYVQAEIIDISSDELWAYDLTLANNTNGWVKETLDLSDFAGKEVILRFGVSQGTSELAGNMFFDFVEFSEPAEQTWNVDPRSGGFFQYATASGKPVTDFTIPSGAVDKETIISYKSSSSAGFPLYPAGVSTLGASELSFAGLAFDLEAFDEFIYLPLIINNSASVAKVEDGYEAVSIESVAATNSFQFNDPIKVTIYYDQSKLDELGIEEKDVYLYYWTGDGWADAATTCAEGDWIDPSGYDRFPDSDYFELNVCHFTRFGTVGVN